MPRVVVVGGGISGLATAYYLAQAGVEATLVEARPRLGGVIRTEQVEGCTLEAGPDSFLSIKPAALDLIRELGMVDQVIGSNDHLRVTFVVRNGRMVALPDGLMMMVPTRILPLLATRLLSWRTKFRMGMELFRAPRPKAEDQSVAEFVAEHYGQEAVEYLAEPLLSGVYGGNPSQLSITAVLPRFAELARQYGSLTRGVLAERRKARKEAAGAPLFRTLKGGLGQLTGAVEASIRGRVAIVLARAEAVERAADGFRVRVAGDWLDATHLVLACEAHHAAPLAAPLDARLAGLLAAIPYSSSMTVALGFAAADLTAPPVGFGFLVPKRERRRLVACTWVGTKFSHRVPEGMVVARCFLGGMEDAGVLDEDDETILAAVREELAALAGVSARPRFARLHRWPRSMAQYTVGHPARVAEIEARARAMGGLHLAGNAYQGIGIPDCIRMGRAAAVAIASAS
jgi:oxygen-dependent protoporphyrinogen oxidase